MQTKKGQTSFEFAILVGFLLFGFTIFFVAMQANLQEELDKRTNTKMVETALSVKNEIDLATESMNGYQRTFTLPTNIYEKDYDIWINQSTLFINLENNKDAITIPLQNVSGQINKYQNTITKNNNGEVILNP